MAEEKALKKIGTIFDDFKCNSNILNAKIEKVNLYKKTNCFDVYLISEKVINIKEVHAFEKFLIKRFNLSNATIKIKYEIGQKIDVKNEWNNIVDYLSYRYPMTKAILRNSEVQIDSNVINVKLHMSGKDFLFARGMNKVFEETLENVYNQKYKINFSEAITEEEETKYKEYTKSLENEALNEFAKQLEEQKIEKEKKKEEKNQSKDEFEIKNVNAPTAADLPPLPDDKDAPPPPEEPEEITPLIYGRNANIKDPFTKVIDISVDSGKICLEGEILNTEERLLKSGKTLYAFDLYDYIASRDFYYDFEGFVPGKIVFRENELINCINAKDFESEKIQKFIKDNFKQYDGHTCDRVIDRILLNKEN